VLCYDATAYVRWRGYTHLGQIVAFGWAPSQYWLRESGAKRTRHNCTTSPRYRLQKPLWLSRWTETPLGGKRCVNATRELALTRYRRLVRRSVEHGQRTCRLRRVGDVDIHRDRTSDSLTAARITFVSHFTPV